MGAVGRESELDAPTTLGTSACCDGLLTNFGVGVSASPMEEGTAVETEGGKLSAAAVGAELTSLKPKSKNARADERKKRRRGSNGAQSRQ